MQKSVRCSKVRLTLMTMMYSSLKAFEDVEFEECYDGCSNDYEFEGVDEEEEDRILDGLSECVFADDFMREEGFDDIEYRTYIIGPVDVESV